VVVLFIPELSCDMVFLLFNCPPVSAGLGLVGAFLSWFPVLFHPVFVALLAFAYIVIYCWLVCRPRSKGY
jgi:hypothetical protein